MNQVSLHWLRVITIQTTYSHKFASLRVWKLAHTFSKIVGKMSADEKQRQ
jgi:hypothetical protein